jgi:preprotein translocase subunit SecE
MSKHRKNKAAAEDSAQPQGAEGAKEAKPAAPAPPRLKSKKEEGEVKAPSGPARLLQFFKDAKKELSRVTWPTRKETFKSTGVLLVLVAISAAYLGLVDGVLSWLLRLLVG